MPILAFAVALLALLMLPSERVEAAPASVSYDVFGTPGQWDVRFSVRQSVPGQILVGFGINLDAVFRGNTYFFNPTAAEYERPPLYVLRGGLERYTPPAATRPEVFNGGWSFVSNSPARFVEAGETQTFQVIVQEATVPTSIRYFIETMNRSVYHQLRQPGGAAYVGSDCTPCGDFNRFFGTAGKTVVTVPAPEAGAGLALLLAGLGACFFGHKRRNA